MRMRLTVLLLVFGLSVALLVLSDKVFDNLQKRRTETPQIILTTHTPLPTRTPGWWAITTTPTP